MSPAQLEAEDHARDAAFNKAMHGQSAQARGGLASLMRKNKDAQELAVEEYFKHWAKKAAEDETDEIREVCMLCLVWDEG